MRSENKIKEDERGVMVFALTAVVILLLSLVIGAYYANSNLQKQERVTDTVGIKETEVRLDQIETELENALWEAGQKAVQNVRSDVWNSDERYTLNELQYKVGENTTRLFEDYFEKNHEGTSQTGSNEFHMHLRPIPENRTDIDMIPLYIREVKGDGSSWKEIPGFFNVERTIHVDIRDEDGGAFSSRKMMINRTVKTNFFILAERMEHFSLSRIERMTNTMLFAYLHMRIYDGGEDFQESWFDKSFQETFDTGWLSEYDGRIGGFEEVEEKDREEIWEKGDADFVMGFLRDIGRFDQSDILTEKDVEHIAELAFLLEQIRTFRSYDEVLLSRISYHFHISEGTLLEYLGDGLENKINLEALIIKLYQEKGVLSDQLHYSGPFLERGLNEDFLNALDMDEEWIETSFGILKSSISGEMDGDDQNWKYDELSDEITPLSALDERKSHLSGLVNLHSNVMEESLEAFKVDEADELVKEDIGSFETLQWMKETEMIGEYGVENITDSILYTATNLSKSFGFEGHGDLDLGSTFYYLYFLSDWGFEGTIEDKTEARERLNEEGMRNVIHGKIRSLLNSRTYDLWSELWSEEGIYEEITSSVEEYGERGWDDGDEERWRDVWDDLNETKEIIDEFDKDPLFDESEKDNTTDTLDDNYEYLKDRIEEIKNEVDWMDPEPKDHTREILDLHENFTRQKWRWEVYTHLSDEYLTGKRDVKDHILYVDDFLSATPSELTDLCSWELTDYNVTTDIEVPPEDFGESVGYATLGSFVEDLERDFLAPLNYTNSYKFFQRVNQNIFDLGGSRSGEDRSRLEAILFGEGDPQSERFNDSRDVKVPLKISNNEIHSSELEDIKSSLIDESYSRTIEKVEDIRGELMRRADELSRKDLMEEPYEEYGLASFYRGTNRVLSPLAKDMESYRRTTSSYGDEVGYLYEVGGKTKTLPVINSPLGGLTVQDGKDEDPGFSYTFDFDINMRTDQRLINCCQISNAASRVYEDDALTSSEWTNPFSEDNQSYYNTFISADLTVPSFDIEIYPSGEYVLTSEKYASAGYKGSYPSRDFTASTELLTPMPFLEEYYNPTSTEELGVNNLSIHQNVFNKTDDELEISFDVDLEDANSFIVEILKDEGVQGRSASRRRKSNYYSTVNKERENLVLLKREYVSIEERKRDEADVEISLSFDEGTFPDEGLERSHLILSVKPDMKLGMMHTEQDLTQEPADTEELYSRLPSTSTSAQIYLVGEEKGSYIGTFNFSSEISEEKKGEFELIKNIPSDSWIIEKSGIPFLVGFEDAPVYRDLIAGKHGRESSVESEEAVDPLVMLEEKDHSKYSFLPESEFRSILENEFVSLFMAASHEENYFYPARVLPESNRNNLETWRSFEKRLQTRGYPVGNWVDIDLPAPFRSSDSRHLKRDDMKEDLDLGVGGYLYYPLDTYHGSERVDHTFDLIGGFGENLGDIQRKREEADFLIGIDEVLDIIKEAGLMDEFLSAGRKEKEDLFLTACKVGDEMKGVEELEERYELVSKGSIAMGLNILGEEHTRETLEWFEENRDDSERNKEFRSFLSFDDTLIEDLSEKYQSDDYGSSLSELDDDLAPLEFTEARDFGIRKLEDIDSLDDLRKEYEDSTILSAVGYGLSPTALKEGRRSHHEVDTEELLSWLDALSGSHYLSDLVDEMNAEMYHNIPSLSFAADSDHTELEWMPFGEDGPPLLIGRDILYYNMSVSDDLDEGDLELLIELTLEDASECFEDFKERGHIVIDLKHDFQLEEDQKGEIRSFILERTREYSPDHHKIGSVELRSGDAAEIRYIHL